MREFYRESIDSKKMSPKLIMDLFQHNTMKLDGLLKADKITRKEIEPVATLGEGIMNVIENKQAKEGTVNYSGETDILNSMVEYNQKAQGIFDKLEQKKAI